ncbi:hypothetical protein Sjap_013154 [Stephania japonica]|uniref:Uncharacterized protein n=1 Tax=Stephania japonica TaxID=461633 RepID=A0AAP0IX83_9MAGN
MAAYESKVRARYKALMHDLLTKGKRPIYGTEEAWRRYVEYWENDDFKAKIQRMREEMSQSAEEAGEDPHDQQNQIQMQQDQIALLQSMLIQSMGGGHTERARLDLHLHLHPPPYPFHQETPTPPTTVPTQALDANDVYNPRMYEPEDEKQTNIGPLQQEWIDAFFDTHPLPRPDRDI